MAYDPAQCARFRVLRYELDRVAGSRCCGQRGLWANRDGRRWAGNDMLLRFFASVFGRCRDGAYFRYFIYRILTVIANDALWRLTMRGGGRYHAGMSMAGGG